MDFAGGTSEQYDEACRRMQIKELAEGGMFHAAGSYGDGWRVIDVWESMEAFDRFKDTQLMEATEAVGIGMPTKVRVVQVNEQKPGSGEDPKLVQVVFIEGMDAEAFHKMDGDVLENGRPPEAVCWHVNGPTEGGWCVVDAWRSKEERDKFIETRIAPAAQRAGLESPPQIEDLAVYATLPAPVGVTG
jgi:quinol monooxygenase YgiN